MQGQCGCKVQVRQARNAPRVQHGTLGELPALQRRSHGRRIAHAPKVEHLQTPVWEHVEVQRRRHRQAPVAALVRCPMAVLARHILKLKQGFLLY
eukprot:scaffold4_cov247-Pinguiococcus_pyrenoidosus.AAC.7